MSDGSTQTSSAGTEIEFTLQDVGIILLTILLVYIIYKFFKDMKKYRNSPPFWNTWLPYVGSIVRFGQNPLAFVQEGRRRFGDVFRAKILGKQMYFITHPSGHEVFFKAYDDELSNKEVYQFMVPVFGKGVVYDAPTPEVMMEQLRFVTAGMTTKNFEGFAPIFEDEVNRLLATLKDEGEFDVVKTFAKVIICTATRCLIGEAMRDYLDKNDLATLFHHLDIGINPINFFIPYFPSSGAKLRDAAKAKIDKIFMSIIQERRKNPEKKYNDVLDTLLHAKYKSGEPVSDEHIIGILIGGLFAGQHTSTITISWTLMLLAKHPEILKRVMKEQEEVMGDSDKLDFEKVSKMELLEMCMKEALRMFPPLVLLMRNIYKPRKYKGYTLTPGDILVVSPSHSHRVEDCWSNPDKFDPDRFARGEHEKYPFQYIAFGGGRHKCIGENFALFQVKSLLSCLLRKLEISMKDPLPTVCYDSLVAGPHDGTSIIQYKKRK